MAWFEEGILSEDVECSEISDDDEDLSDDDMHKDQSDKELDFIIDSLSDSKERTKVSGGSENS